MTKHRVVVRDRTDRHKLISMFEQSGQICQIRADKFGESEAGQQQAASIMVELAKKYCEDKVKRIDLSKMKRSLLCKHVQAAPRVRKSALKRPPAAIASSPQPDQGSKLPSPTSTPKKRMRFKAPGPSVTPPSTAMASPTLSASPWIWKRTCMQPASSSDRPSEQIEIAWTNPPDLPGMEAWHDEFDQMQLDLVDLMD